MIKKVSYDKVMTWIEPSEPVPTLESTTMNTIELYMNVKNVDKKTAETAISKLTEIILKESPGLNPDEVIQMKLKTAGSDATGEKAKLLLVACGAYEDENQPKRLSHLKQFKDNPDKAISEGLVVLNEKNEPVAVENKEFYDEAKTRKNPNYGKPIPESMKRKAFFIDQSGKLLRGSGKFDGTPGEIAIITGKITENGFVSVYKKGYKVQSVLSPEEFFKSVDTALGSSPIAVGLESVWDQKNYADVALKGRVAAALETKTGGGMIVLTQAGMDDDVVGFADPESPVVPIISENLEKGMEAIVLGQVSKYIAKDGTDRKSIRVLAVVPNPASADLASVLSKLDNYDI